MYVAKLMVSYLVKLHLFKIILRLYQNHTPTLPKSHSDFHKITAWFGWLIFTKSHSDFAKITLRLCQNHTPTLRKSHSDFHKITAWFSQHHWLIFTKSHSDFAKITLRLCQNHTPTLPKSHSDFHKITAWFGWLIFTKSHSDFAKITLRLYQNRRLICTKSLTDFHKNEGWFWSPRLLFYCTPFQNRTLPHCASCLSEGFSSFVTSLPGSPHCFCPCLWKKNLVLFTGSSCLAFHHFAVLR